MFTINGEGIPGETWKRVCVVLNSVDEADAEIILPAGDWIVVLDEHAAAAVSQQSTINSQPSAKFTVRHKSGVVLFQP